MLDKADKKNNVLIDEFIDHLWLEYGLSKNTLNSYRFDLYNFIDWLNQNKTLDLESVTR